jgi:Na+-transporting NADH:ubiquinone oxidoreductase subunit NqrE
VKRFRNLALIDTPEILLVLIRVECALLEAPVCMLQRLLQLYNLRVFGNRVYVVGFAGYVVGFAGYVVGFAGLRGRVCRVCVVGFAG